MCFHILSLPFFFYRYIMFYNHCKLFVLGWEPSKLLELVFKPTVYYIFNKICLNEKAWEKNPINILSKHRKGENNKKNKCSDKKVALNTYQTLWHQNEKSLSSMWKKKPEQDPCTAMYKAFKHFDSLLYISALHL